MRALVFANGDCPAHQVVDELHAAANLTVAADGGVANARAVGIRPDVVVGDLDSLGDEERMALPAGRLVHDPDPDRTDLQKAIDVCLARGATRVDVVGASGGRADHALANLSVLVGYRGRAEIRLHDELFEVRAVDGTAIVEGPEGTVVSLVAIGECSGVTTTGLRWDLQGALLRFSPLGIHNEIKRSPATVSVASGDLLLFRGRWIEKHR